MFVKLSLNIKVVFEKEKGWWFCQSLLELWLVILVLGSLGDYFVVNQGLFWRISIIVLIFCVQSQKISFFLRIRMVCVVVLLVESYVIFDWSVFRINSFQIWRSYQLQVYFFEIRLWVQYCYEWKESNWINRLEIIVVYFFILWLKILFLICKVKNGMFVLVFFSFWVLFLLFFLCMCMCVSVYF